MWFVRIALASLVVVGGGCALVLDLDDARTREPDTLIAESGGAPDATSDASDAPGDGARDGSDDGLADALAADADAADADAADALLVDTGPDAVVPSKCVGAGATLCLDFESGTLADLPLLVTRTSASESVDFTSDARRGLRALRATHAGGSTTVEHSANLLKQFPGWKTTEIEVDLKITATWADAGPHRAVELASLQFLPAEADGSTFLYLALNLGPSGLTIYWEATGGLDGSGILGALPKGWTRIRLKAIVPATSPGTGKYEVEMYPSAEGDVSVVTGALAFNKAPQSSAITKMQVGVRRFAGPGPAVSMSMDDLLVRR
jgi:hypothetical protein